MLFRSFIFFSGFSGEFNNILISGIKQQVEKYLTNNVVRNGTDFNETLFIVEYLGNDYVRGFFSSNRHRLHCSSFLTLNVLLGYIYIYIHIYIYIDR